MKGKFFSFFMSFFFISFFPLAFLFFFSFLFLSLSSLPTFAQGNFNVNINLPHSYESVSAGEAIYFTTKIVNLGSKNRVDINLKYEIIDSNELVLSSKSQTVAIETQASFVETILLPKDVRPGKYFLKVTLRSEELNSEIYSQTTFNVVSKKINTQTIKEIYISLGVILSIFILLYVITKLRHLLRKAVIRREVHRIVKKKMQ